MRSYARLRMTEGEVMPAHRPYYPLMPSYYRNVEFQRVFFRADPDVVRAHLPEPLEPDPEGIAVAASIRVPFCSHYGPFHESALSLRCLLGDQLAFFTSHVFLDNVAAICSGRERWGTPKEYAEVKIDVRGNLIYSQTIKEGVSIMTLTSGVSQPATIDEIMSVPLNLRLKLIPKADGPGAAIKQLVHGSPRDMVVHQLFKGSGMVTFGSTANSDLSPFAPREILGAFHLIASYTETYGEIVLDYLEGREHPR